jgi:hypothetical protein
MRSEKVRIYSLVQTVEADLGALVILKVNCHAEEFSNIYGSFLQIPLFRVVNSCQDFFGQFEQRIACVFPEKIMKICLIISLKVLTDHSN